MNKEFTQEELTNTFIEKAKKVWGSRYDYSLVEYFKSHIKVKLICPKHGVFIKTPNNFLKGQGCPKCYYEQRSEEKKITPEDFLKKAKKIHGEKYTYNLNTLKGVNSKVKITCPIHGDFYQMVRTHIYQKSGCPKCRGKKGKS